MKNAFPSQAFAYFVCLGSFFFCAWCNKACGRVCVAYFARICIGVRLSWPEPQSISQYSAKIAHKQHWAAIVVDSSVEFDFNFQFFENNKCKKESRIYPCVLCVKPSRINPVVSHSQVTTAIWASARRTRVEGRGTRGVWLAVTHDLHRNLVFHVCYNINQGTQRHILKWCAKIRKHQIENFVKQLK